MNKLQEEFYAKLKEILLARDMSLLSEEYTKASDKYLVKDNKSGEEWEIQGRTILHGKIIKKSEISKFRSNNTKNNISSRELIPIEKIISEIIKLHPELQYDSGYQNKDTKCKFYCKDCKNYFSTKPKYLLNGHSCPICGQKRSITSRSKSNRDFKKEISELTNGEYEVLSDYVNQLTPVRIKHLKCGKEYDVVPKRFLRGDRCRSCMDKKVSKSKIKFQNYLNEVEPEYEILSEFNGRKKPITLLNKKFNEIYETSPDKFIAGVRSPSESASKGETFIKSILNENHVKFIMNYKEQNLKDKKPLEFDFKLNDQNIFIEFNGIQHYQNIDFFNNDLQYVQKHDKMKIDYCKENNYPFLIIPYNISNEDQKKLLLEFLQKNNLLGALKSL